MYLIIFFSVVVFIALMAVLYYVIKSAINESDAVRLLNEIKILLLNEQNKKR